MQSNNLMIQYHTLSDGTKVVLPIRYIDNRCLWATFLTDLDRAAQVLKGTGLQAVPQEDGKAVVLYLCWEYRKTDIGPYNEVAVTVLAVAPQDPAPAIYVADLPVTTEAANRAGQELWGYNKFVTNIEIKGDGKQFSAIVHDPQNGLISSLEGTRGVSVPVAPTDIYSFSLLEKKIIKTFVQVPTPWHASGGEGFVLRVGDSTHRMAGHLRTLGLDGAHPVLVQYADPFQSLLFPGKAL
ncbi:MAG TPA: acetoacetate decarboxylase family protein [Ktedonobacteraceae bacterium]|nr:acetoacetate decarboxylase family protein [Ktedonobacteraceae bacterium]